MLLYYISDNLRVRWKEGKTYFLAWSQQYFAGRCPEPRSPGFSVSLYIFTFVTLSFLTELTITCLYPTILTLVSLSYCRTLFFTLSLVYILYAKVIYRGSTIL
jgi:hypothetical protein